MKRYPWETWQEMYVLSQYRIKPTADVCAHVGKTPLAVRLKYHRMMGKRFKVYEGKQTISRVSQETAA